MAKNIFVVGLDAFNGAKLARVECEEPLTIHELLAYDEVKGVDVIDFNGLYQTACERLRAFEGSIDGIVGWWDFPTTSLVPMLCQTFGVPGPPLEAVLKCEHKYWSRLVQHEVVPDYIPKSCVVDPFVEDPLSQINIDYPFWIKPVKGFASQLGFRIGGPEDFEVAISTIREEIGRIGDPFNELLQTVERPQEIRNVGGHFCIVEEIIGGRQCTLEGYAFEGNMEIYGFVDSIRLPNRSSFARYQYPSKLPKRIQRWMVAIAKRLMSHIGYDNGTFNVEFFYDTARKKLWLLEVNPRLSQSHADMFEKVHGVPHFQIMVDIALGKEPRWIGREGPANCAAKFFLRRFSDARVTAVPSEAEIERAAEQYPGTEIDVRISPGMLLSQMHDQDAYSYEIADIFMGASNQQELLANFRAVRKGLKFRFARPKKRVADQPKMQVAGSD